MSVSNPKVVAALQKMEQKDRPCNYYFYGVGCIMKLNS